LGLTLTPHPLPLLPSLQVVVNAGCASLLAMQAEVHVRSEVPPKDNSAPIKKVPPMATAGRYSGYFTVPVVVRVLHGTHSTTGTSRYPAYHGHLGYLTVPARGGGRGLFGARTIKKAVHLVQACPAALTWVRRSSAARGKKS
jgi:hypothetical protein